MIDIHCHILPGVDDGSDSLETSVLMAAMAADDGVTDIITTPHVTYDSKFTVHDLQDKTRAFNVLKRELKVRGIPLNIHPGAEVLLVEDMPPADPDVFPRLAGTNYVLVEFNFDETTEMMTGCLEKVLDAELWPVLAHPERYSAVQKKKNILVEWISAGVTLQMNKGSLEGKFGIGARKTAEWMMKNRIADLWATDAHNISGRNTRVSRARAEMSKKYGESYVMRISGENPAGILAGRVLK